MLLSMPDVSWFLLSPIIISDTKIGIPFEVKIIFVVLKCGIIVIAEIRFDRRQKKIQCWQ